LSASLVLSYLKAMADYNASDLYLTVGHPPSLRIENRLQNISDKSMSPEEIGDLLNSILTGRQKREFETTWELNASLDMASYGRFRVNVLRQRQFPAIVIRRIISKIPSFQELSLPKTLESLSLEQRGLILVTGITGSGKSTTLASMVDYRNSHEMGHIVTIEDPIEYFHEHKKSVVTQREVGVDTESYAVALKNALRQRPDVILVGEIRDRTVMEQALIAAETGHLCLATIHTTNAYQAIERIVNFFPEEYGYQIRLNLSINLKAIISQRLVPTLDEKMVPAIELLLNQGLVRDLIMKGETMKIREVMEQNKSSGMFTFDQSLLKLYEEGKITDNVAIMNADRPSDMKIKIHHLNLSDKKGTGMSTLQKFDTSKLALKD
jgi:twitching motility protein PilU